MGGNEERGGKKEEDVKSIEFTARAGTSVQEMPLTAAATHETEDFGLESREKEPLRYDLTYELRP